MTDRSTRVCLLLPIFASFLLASVATLPLAAQTVGRIELTVATEAGEPVQGVQVVITQDELGRFRMEKKTNKRGVAIVSLVDATKVYLFTLTHPDFVEIRQYLKPDLGTTKKVDITIGATEPVDLGVGAADEDAPPPTYSAAESAFNEGVSFLQQEQYAVGRDKFLEALELDPKLIVAHDALARTYSEMGEHEKAIAEAELFLAAKPNSPSSFRVLYDAHVALGNKSEADMALKSLKGSGTPDDTAAMLYNEGVAAFRVGDDTEAERRFNESLEVKPDLAPALKALSVVYQRSGKPVEAAATAERYLELDPDDDVILRLRYDAYTAAGDRDGVARATAGLSPEAADAIADELYMEGARLFEAGDVPNAVVKLQGALGLSPDHAHSHYHLGLSLLNTGDSAGARTHLSRFLELAPDHSEAASAKEMLGYLE